MSLFSDSISKFIKPEPQIHDQRVTLHHWYTNTQTTIDRFNTSLMTQYGHRQLRDLVLQPPDPEYKDELIVPVEQDIFRASVFHAMLQAQWAMLTTILLGSTIHARADGVS